jgi:hypothetical protein
MYSSLVVVVPPGSEPLDIEVVRRHCRLTQHHDDDLLAMYLTAAREWCEGILDRAVLPQTLRYSWVAGPPPTATPLVPQSLIIFPLNFPPLVRRAIELPRAPVIAVNSVLWGPIDNLQTAAPDEYTINLSVDPAQLLIKPQLVPILPQQMMQIEYVAGYADADHVPNNIKLAILTLTAFYYEQRGDVEAEAPAAVMRLLGQNRLWTFSG